MKSLPILDKMFLNLVKSYFNLYSVDKEKKATIVKLRRRFRRLSINKIFVSKAELKHTNSKVVITLYLYNRQKQYFLNKIKNLDMMSNLLENIKTVQLKSFYLKDKVSKEVGLIFDTKFENKGFQNYEDKSYFRFVKRYMEKEILSVYYKHLLFINKSKFENTYLRRLTNLVNKIYGKQVEFNLVNVKYLYMNSDIFTQSIVLKLKKRKNSLLKVLKSSLNLVDLPFYNKLTELYNFYNKDKEKLLMFNKMKKLSPNSLFYGDNVTNSKDNLNETLFNILPMENDNTILIDNILSSLKHNTINGVRLEAAGRLTRRLTASRSVFKLRYKGSIKNIDSSYKGISSVILRGHLKSNLQYTCINSKTRNGAFGIKG